MKKRILAMSAAGREPRGSRNPEPHPGDLAMSARIAELRDKFPTWKIVSDPDPKCNCKNGERTTKTGLNVPCLCVCLTPFGAGDDRASFVREVGAAARRLRARSP